VTRGRLLQELPTLDEIRIVVGGPGVPSASLDTSKRKGKAVTPVRNDDEVLSDDDHPLVEEEVAP
jgi:hypothetical protein